MTDDESWVESIRETGERVEKRGIHASYIKAISKKPFIHDLTVLTMTSSGITQVTLPHSHWR